MNTVFKFHFQSWILLNLGVSLLIPIIFQEIDKKVIKSLTLSLISVLVFVGMIYPIYSIRPRILDRFNNDYKGLDGIDYMKTSTYLQTGSSIDLSSTYFATQWINNNVQGVIKE